MTQAADIRRAGPADAGTIQQLLEALAEATGKPGAIAGTPADILRFGFGKHPLFEAWIARRGEQDLGLLLGFPEYSSWRGRPGFYVQDLYVDPAARGQGLAAALLAQAVRHIGETGGCYLRLSADAANVSAHGFYRKAGFRAAEEERIFVLEGDAFAALSAADTGSTEP